MTRAPEVPAPPDVRAGPVLPSSGALGGVSEQVASEPVAPGRGAVLRGGLWSAASQLVPALGTAVLSVAAGRLLGSGPLGQQSLIAYVNSAITSVFVISLNTALLQVGGGLQGVGASGRLRHLTRWAVGAHAAVGVGVALIMLVSGEVVGHYRLAWAVIGAVSILDALVDGLAVRMILSEGWAPIGRLRLLFQMLGPLFGIGFLLAGLGVTGIFLGDGAAALGLLIAVTRRFRRLPPELLAAPVGGAGVAVEAASEPARRRRPIGRYDYRPLPGPRRFSPVAAPSPVLRMVLLFAVGALITQVVSKRVEFVVLSAFSGDRAVGQYSVAFMAVSLLSMVPLGVATAAMPLIAAATGRGEIADTHRHLRYALRIGTAVTIPVAGLLAALGPSVVEFVYGSQYATAARLVPFASGALLFAVIIGVCEQFWSGQGRLGVVLGTGALAGVVDIGLALILVPHLGPTGAVAANVSGQATLALGLLMITVRRTGAVGWRLRGLASAVLSGAAGIAAVLLVRAAVFAVGPSGLEVRSGLVVVIGSAAGLAAVACVVRLARLFDVDEAAWIGGMLPARLHRVVAGISQAGHAPEEGHSG